MTEINMTHEQKIKEIVKKCSECNEDIMKLQFGCKIMVGDMERTMISFHEDVGYKTLLNTNTFYISKETMEFSKMIEILGREITLADVLLAIENTGVSITFYGAGKMWFVMTKNLKKGRTGYENVTWNLLKPLSGQSIETISFIYELIK